jgi:predicted SnoaL-like aldol condensation-catalyzing enzyme
MARKQRPGDVPGTQGYERVVNRFIEASSEGSRAGVHASFYDLYRVEAGKIVEHWDTLEAVAPPEDWKHDNGKF